MQVISRDVYKQVLERAVDKVVTMHADAPDASFLVEEAGKVQRMVSDYVQHLRGRSMAVSDSRLVGRAVACSITLVSSPNE